MTRRWVSIAAMLTVVAAASTGQVRAAGCKLQEVQLDCGAGSNASMLEAFAAPQTREFLEKPLDYLTNFSRPADLETFRKSVETVWRAANRQERVQRRKMRRRQISAAEFEEWSKIYDDGLKNYRSALTFYRTLIWHGKND